MSALNSTKLEEKGTCPAERGRMAAHLGVDWAGPASVGMFPISSVCSRPASAGHPCIVQYCTVGEIVCFIAMW